MFEIRTMHRVGRIERPVQPVEAGVRRGGLRVPSDVMAFEPYVDLAKLSARAGAFDESGGIAARDGRALSGSECYVTLSARAMLPCDSDNRHQHGAGLQFGRAARFHPVPFQPELGARRPG